MDSAVWVLVPDLFLVRADCTGISETGCAVGSPVCTNLHSSDSVHSLYIRMEVFIKFKNKMPAGLFRTSDQSEKRRKTDKSGESTPRIVA